MASAVTGSTRLAAVIGDPVRHSRSPAMFNAAFEACDLDWVYTAFEVPEGRAVAATDAMRALGIAGLSVTMPHKAAVIDGLDELTDGARALGAVNCITNAEGHLTGHNTDGAGFVASLRRAGVEPAGLSAVVLGAGGAARAVIHALGEAGAEGVAVANRSADRAELAAALATTGRPLPMGDLPEALGTAGLLVNATSLGMREGDAPVVDPRHLHPDLVVSDLVYQPLETPLLAAAEAAGCRTVDGLGMLLHQAAIAFELITGLPAPFEAMASAAGFGA